jgi:hypothetical protein
MVRQRGDVITAHLANQSVVMLDVVDEANRHQEHI